MLDDVSTIGPTVDQIAQKHDPDMAVPLRSMCRNLRLESGKQIETTMHIADCVNC